MRLTVLLLLLFLFSFASHAQIEWASAVLEFSGESAEAGIAKPYGAQQVLGKPNKLPAHGESPCAWRTATANNNRGEWIKVTFNKLISAQTIVIAESWNPGAVAKIKLYDEAGKEYTVYHNPAPKPIPQKVQMLVLHIAPTPYKVAALRLELQTAAVPGFNQIDAIGISENKIQVGMDVGLNRVKTLNENRIESLGMAVNSEYDEIMPVIAPDGQTLYFVRKNHPDNVRNPFIPQLLNDDIWFTVRKPDGTWEEARHMPAPLNNYSHNYVCTALPDNNTLLLANRYLPEGRCIVGVSVTRRKNNDEWEFPQALAIGDFYNQSPYSEYFMAANQQVLLMAVQRNDTYGGRDLYVSFRQENGAWSVPLNLGAQVNTAGSEITPVLAADNKTLYFASNGISGYGEMDIYMTRRLDETWQNWSEPVNLGPPINTEDWDASYTIDAKGEYAYLVSYHQGIKGSADLFRLKLAQEVRPEQVLLASGRVFNAQTNAPIAAHIVYTNPADDKLLGTANTNPVTGAYQISLPLKQSYGIRASAKGFFSLEERIDLSADSAATQPIVRDLFLVPLEEGQAVRLNNVFFEQGTATLLPDSFTELRRLIHLMNEYPLMEIRLEGHTDVEGNPMLNMQLSKERVQSIRQYLVKEGIAENRITTEAFGSTRPLTRSRDEASKRLNRRVEFRILKVK
ncbi:OmpA family protein [Rhodoflexus caldus]|uniref:OmpA family protein n=1 Tax=Rhodoflexus caldus TaxID=2891236 RepID=UPI00202A6C77|nr:OmpA family protein [Rhodoflexus caldus]